MKNTKKHLQKRIVKATMALGTLALGMAIFSPAHAVFNPYFGADVGLKNTGFRTGYGSHIFKSVHKIGRAFAGIEIVPSLDVEFSVEKSLVTSKKDLSATHSSRTKFFAVGTDLIHKYTFPSCQNVKLLTGVGVKNLRVKLNGDTSSDADTPFNGSFSLDKNKLILKGIVGLEYMFNNYIGTRTLLTVENTSRIKPTSGQSAAKLRNSAAVSVGVVAKL
jgi:hypothetical protein